MFFILVLYFRLYFSLLSCLPLSASCPIVAGDKQFYFYWRCQRSRWFANQLNWKPSRLICSNQRPDQAGDSGKPLPIMKCISPRSGVVSGFKNIPLLMRIFGRQRENAVKFLDDVDMNQEPSAAVYQAIVKALKEAKVLSYYAG